MKARVFFDAFAECLVGLAMVRRHPSLLHGMRDSCVRIIARRHGDNHADNTRRMFDRLWADVQKPGETK